MAKLRVTCPSCNSELELDSEDVGQEIECGNCLQVFFVEPPRNHRVSNDFATAELITEEDDPPRRRRRRRYYNEEDERPRHSTSPLCAVAAIISLALGILSLPDRVVFA